jgi:tetratricopeptide (TPR) repeat protein
MNDGPSDDRGTPRPAPDDRGSAQLWQSAVASYRAGRWQEALARCRELLATTFPPPDAFGLAGMLALRLGDAAGAVDYFAEAIQRKPESADFHYNFGNALTRLGRHADAIEAYRRAAAYRPDLVPAHNNLGTALEALGRTGEAIEAFRHALTLAPNDAGLHRNLGVALENAGRLEEATAAFRRALERRHDLPLVHHNLATVLLAQGDAAGASAICDAWRRLEPGSLEPIGLKAVALDELGDRDGARRLVDLDRFLRQRAIDRPPAGFASMATFNAALAQHLLADPTLAVPGARAPNFNGPAFRTTDEIFDRPTGPMVALQAMIEQQIGDYLATVARPDPSHPYLAHPPRRWRPTAQATVLDYDGSLAPHVHYSGYVSGVYYVEIPDVIRAARPDHAGWLEVGRPPARYLRRGRPEIRYFEPRPGTMILFPSYFYHSTVPFAVSQTRISVAFDATPVP